MLNQNYISTSRDTSQIDLNEATRFNLKVEVIMRNF